MQRLQQVNKTAQKQPNKLVDLFGNNDPLMGNSISEHEMNDPQNVSNQKQQARKLIDGQGESLSQMQKRPSTHKNKETGPKIFEIDKSTINEVRKTEELNITVNPNPEVVDSNNNNQNNATQQL